MGKKVAFFTVCVFLVGLALANPLHADLIGWWTFDEGAGTTAGDSSGNGNAGELNGTLEWATGKIDGALDFDGATGYVLVPHSDSLKVLNEGDFTISAWFKLDALPTVNQMVVQQGDNNGNGRTWLFVAADEEIRSFLGNTTTGSGVYVEADTWYHAAVVVTEGGATDSVQVYVNGEAAGNPVAVGMETSEGDYYIGCHKNLTNFWDGLIDDVRLYNHGLNAVELRGLILGGPYPFAIGTAPQEGAVVDQTVVTLEWLSGELAASHLVYVGESFDEVENGLVEPVATTQESLMLGVAAPYPTGLTPGQTYYWRVDEVDETNPESPWKGEVMSFQVRPAVAWAPTPADGVPYVHPDQDLAWEIGLGTLFHTVYFGDSFDEVNDATTGGFMIAEPTYDPGTLETEKTYYWRVDEFSGSATEKGDVWSFTTVPAVEVTDPSLTGWWTLDEGEGQTAVDWSGHGHHGTINGAAEWTDGYQGSALTFADDAYVEAPYEGITGTASRTCCAWIRTGIANRSILSWGQNVAGQKWRMRLDATGGLRIEVNGGYNYGVQNLADDQWHHVAIVLEDDGSPDVLETILYVDGEVEPSAASADEPIDTAAGGVVWIGETPWHNAPWLDEIDDVRIYDKVLTEQEIAEVMRGNVLLASNPEPARGAIADIREATALRWQAGDGAVSHDVYFGADKEAVRAANKDGAEYQGNQAATSFSLAGLVELGGGAYFWRIDEVAADATVQEGDVWSFTVPAYLIVDDFESYSNEVGARVFEFWIDGIGYTLPEPGNPGNGTGAAVGHDIWSVTSPYFDGTIMETANVHDGRLAMPLYYDNTASPYLSEAERTWAVPENWTAEGVTDLTLYIRGDATNDATAMYVAVEDTAGRVAVVPHPDAAVTAVTGWTEWKIPLADLTDAGVTTNAVKKMTIGVGNRAAPTPDGAGVVFIDDIRVTAP